MQANWRKTLNHWLHGVRFYIAIAIGLLSLEIWWWASASYGGSSLFAIRLEETYAWSSVIFLSAALLIGPFFSIFRNLPGRFVAYDARRLLGIGAAWFASLHIGIAYLSLFKLANPLHVPGHYRQAFIFGGIAWLILLAMAFTSFDAAFRGMGKWWFRLHRLVYVAATLTLFHAFTVGSQATQPLVMTMLGLMAGLLIGLHSFAMIKKGDGLTIRQLSTVAAMTAVLVLVFSFGYSKRSQYSAAAITQGGSYVQDH